MTTQHRIFGSVATLVFAAVMGAQTNTFPSSEGSVGIGTTSPSEKLTVHGNSAAIRIETDSGPASYFAKLVANYDASKAVQFFGANGIELWRDVANASPQAFTLMPGGGNVGIGTITPSEKLTVHGDGAAILLETDSSSSSYFAKLVANYDASKAVQFFGANGTELWRDVANASPQAFTLMPGGGNVGIGTITPSEKLTVHGDGAAILLESDSNSSAYFAKLVSNYNALKAEQLFGAGGTELWRHVYASPQVLDLMPGGGNVGIGTTNPTDKLSVNGTVRAKEVIVDSGWSDYVFDKSYKLKALSETEAFIEAEKHLPGMPSATEVAEHGISLGEMQAKLLAKIEELTLHQIEQAKHIEAVEAENALLRTRLSRLESPIQ